MKHQTTKKTYGTIVSIVEPRGFGFIEVPGQDRHVFFHFRQLVGDLAFDQQLVERRVKFYLVDGDRGVLAKAIEAVD